MHDDTTWRSYVEGLIGVATGHFANKRTHAGLGICISQDYILNIICDMNEDE
ncbi:MAG: hypothetical protein GPJ52_03820 [Candidatus Heimdallarchaeota archaeon]|nr:hypothetical protein [Candidatus Heimdallarchaeota archaeon]